MWYSRAKGLSPLPTPEQLIEAGEVYALIVSSWDKLRGCGGYYPTSGRGMPRPYKHKGFFIL